jgi:threonine/homoserine/homoserine lactone efflux protein
MIVDTFSAGLFLLAAALLLGSPGPGIVALLAIGKQRGFAGSLRFYWGLQAGLALAAAVVAAGLFSILEAAALVRRALTILAAAYLIWLAVRIASAPVGAPHAQATSARGHTALSGFLLGASNPKAYVAIASLMAAYPIVRADPSADAAVKWLLCIAVIMSVDIVWLWLGVVLGKAELKPRAERALNVAMGAAILATAAPALF